MGRREPPGSSELVKGKPSRRPGTCWGTHGDVRDWLEAPRGGLGRVGGPSGMSGTGRGTLREVWDGSGDPRAGLGRVE